MIFVSIVIEKPKKVVDNYANGMRRWKSFISKKGYGIITVQSQNYIGTNDTLNNLLLPYIIDLINNRKQSFTDYELMVKASLFAIMNQIFQFSTKANSMERSLHTTYNKLKKSFLYVQTNYANPIILKDAAAALLCDGNLKIIEISEKTGFHNHSYFTRSFTAKYGISPSEYRRNR